MPMKKKFVRFASRFLIGFFALIAVYFLAAYALAAITLNKSHQPALKDVAVYVMSNGVHTDVVLPAKTPYYNWTKQIKYSYTKGADSSYNYLAFGWGDRKFYLETPGFKDLKFTVALRAISGLGSTVMHTSYCKNLIEGNNCKKIWLNQKEYHALCAYILKGFKTDAFGNLILINNAANYDESDAFYEGVGSYSIFKTCNTWANNALKSAQQKCCLWTIFDKPILEKYR